MRNVKHRFSNYVLLLLMLIFGALSLVMTLLSIRLKPDFNQRKSLTEIEELKRIHNKKSKKHPKRRKDYS